MTTKCKRFKKKCLSSKTTGTYSHVEFVEIIKYKSPALADPIGDKSFAESNEAKNGLNHFSAISTNTAALISLCMKQNKTQEADSNVAEAPRLPPQPPPSQKETVKLSIFQLPPQQPSIPTKTNQKKNAARKSSKIFIFFVTARIGICLPW